MATVPLLRARSSLSLIIEQRATHPVNNMRNGKPVAVIVHADQVIDGGPITSDLRSAVRADLMHALALLDSAGHPGE